MDMTEHLMLERTRAKLGSLKLNISSEVVAPEDLPDGDHFGVDLNNQVFISCGLLEFQNSHESIIHTQQNGFRVYLYRAGSDLDLTEREDRGQFRLLDPAIRCAVQEYIENWSVEDEFDDVLEAIT